MSQEAIEWLESQPLHSRLGSVVVQPLMRIKDDDPHEGDFCSCYGMPAFPLSVPWTPEVERAWLDGRNDLFYEFTRPETLHARHREYFRDVGQHNVILAEDGYQHRLAPDGVTFIKEEATWPSSTKTA